ncbi:MAG: hypothetical protein EOT05_03605 [Candidatus Microsaccharimonas sossegonensis]|uniref:Uncharacterized protein n=1 Tax=Candidatus Microsaccharimonas sossegonensis TaxID=2506948 RepID=A0A4Q0AID4_9BACT|nr:MAG: hypothetical protein EOT05_03605 [Candidatus Microsaccharimonas sossegonensis]
MNQYNNSHVNITYRLRNILELNGRSLESVDLTPAALANIITQIDAELSKKMIEEAAFNQEYRPTASRFIRPVVLIARLALEDQPFMALNRRALQSGERYFTHGSVLTEEALPYWNSVAGTGYQPQVHNLRSTDASTAGIWLGISEK